MYVYIQCIYMLSIHIYSIDYYLKVGSIYSFLETDEF
jgi:hypothetical protein